MSILKRLFNLARAEFVNLTQGEREVSEEFWQFFKQQPDTRQYKSYFESQHQQQTYQPREDFSGGNRGYNPYQALNVSPSASWEEIEKAYRQAARQYHPDRFQNAEERETAIKVMVIVNASYAFLKKKYKAN